MSLLLTIVTLLLGVLFLVLGFLFITDGDKGMKIAGHEQSALVKVMGGRYFGIAIIIFGLFLVSGPLSLAVVFVAVSFLGFIDALLTSKAGGDPKGHFVVGVIAAAVAVGYYMSAAAVGV
jgi:hypothetical protein